MPLSDIIIVALLLLLLLIIIIIFINIYKYKNNLHKPHIIIYSLFIYFTWCYGIYEDKRMMHQRNKENVQLGESDK